MSGDLWILGDHKLLALARFIASAVGLDALVIAQRTAEEQVIPGSHVQRGNLDVREMLFDRERLPVIVVAGMSQPIKKIRRYRGV